MIFFFQVDDLFGNIQQIYKMNKLILRSFQDALNRFFYIREREEKKEKEEGKKKKERRL